MENLEIFKHIDRLKLAVEGAQGDYPRTQGVKAQITEFLSLTAGPKSSFLQLVQTAPTSMPHLGFRLVAALDSFKEYIESGLHSRISPQRKVQIDVVSDFLEQAQHLLNGKGVHPAAPIVLIGATLEEFLRNWIEGTDLSLGQKKPCLDTYAQVLLAADLISKQDMKDITAWGGLRNHAAHGEWAEVSEKQRAAIMLDGVNLFMRKHGG
ncbi:MAG TPA: hypothetical protein PLS22_05930 [Aquabacterium sp.]|nr:hypothetical protein [Aquabacterium sp.]